MDRAEILFYEALKLAPPDRAAFLDQECGGDSQLRDAVEQLLDDLEKAGEFLDTNESAQGEFASELARFKAEKAGDRIGPYKLLEQVGEGGFGRVWVAEQERPVRRRVALKIIKLGMDTHDVIARFEQERQALAMMEHPNIARVFDAGATEFGRPYFVMEFVPGVKITDYCDCANLSTRERLTLFIAVCHAVQHAHQKGIIHRDLKPSNILVTLHDGVPVPKVIDFGVAKATQQQRLTDLTVYTKVDQMIGTPLYMSPEQAEMSGLDIDTRSDIYSLGVLLYELLTGRTPFDPEHLMKASYDEMRRVIREDEPPRPSTLVSTMKVEVRTDVAKRRGAEAAKLISSIRGDLDWIVMKALEKDRNRRYETANGLARDVERHLNSEPVQARPPSAGYRFRRLVQRNRGAFVAGVSIAAALLIGTIISVSQAMRVRTAANRANAALSDLRASAPAFAAMAQNLIEKEQFDEAVEKLDTAIKLRPDVLEYTLRKANVLESQLKFPEAASLYRDISRRNPSEKRAETHAVLCEKLANELGAQGKLSRESLVELFTAMREEQRPGTEMMRVARLLGEENQLLVSYWTERLKDLPIPSDQPLAKRLTVTKEGELALDLSGTELTDLTLLRGMPLSTLRLSRCDKLVDVSSLRGLPLRTLFLDGTEVVDLSPLSGMASLTTLSLQSTKVRDLSALHDLPLKTLDLGLTLVADLSPLHGTPLVDLNLSSTSVSDLTPLQGIPLRRLDLSKTYVRDLSPLAGMPLQVLDCGNIPAEDFSPLRGMPLQHLSLWLTAVNDLSIFKEMPLKVLYLNNCFHTKGFSVLTELKTLEALTLPSISRLKNEDVAAIRSLKHHPTLQSINIGGGSFPSKETFWSDFEKLAYRRNVRAEIHDLARQGQYETAAQKLRGLIKGDQEYVNLQFNLGVMLLADGDIPAYQATCREMVQKFRRRVEGDEVSVRLCVLSADCGVPLADVRRLMPHLALINPRGYFRCWYVLTNGLLEYRSGDPRKAIQILSEMQTNDFTSALAGAAAALSMAYCAEGDIKAAEAQLSHARRLVQEQWLNLPPEDGVEGEWVLALLLSQEAERVLTASRASPQKESAR